MSPLTLMPQKDTTSGTPGAISSAMCQPSLLELVRRKPLRIQPRFGRPGRATTMQAGTARLRGHWPHLVRLSVKPRFLTAGRRGWLLPLKAAPEHEGHLAEM